MSAHACRAEVGEALKRDGGLLSSRPQQAEVPGSLTRSGESYSGHTSCDSAKSQEVGHTSQGKDDRFPQM